MATIKAFKAIRPRNDLAKDVAALPYDVMSSEEAREIAKDNPYSFLHVDKPEIDLEKNIDLYDEKVYNKAKENLYKLIKDGILVEDDAEYIYLYRLIMNGRTQTGIVACASIDDYLNNVIKKHEFTRVEKEQDRVRHIEACVAHTGPIFLTYKFNQKISDIISDYTKNTPEVSLKADDGIEHIVWKITEKEIIKDICSTFSNINSLYIADGHHRAAAAVRVGENLRKQNPGFTGKEEFNYFLSVIFQEDELYIMDYNRVVKDLNGLSADEYMNRVSENFNIRLYEGEGAFKPLSKHTYGMYLEGKWYELTFKKEASCSHDPVENLDVSILQNYILSPILGIRDPRKDNRIDFIGGIRGLKELEKIVNSNNSGVAFSMYPTDIKELMEIADINKVMPPKSTWFEPKLRSGLFIHKI